VLPQLTATLRQIGWFGFSGLSQKTRGSLGIVKRLLEKEKELPQETVSTGPLCLKSPDLWIFRDERWRGNSGHGNA